MKTFQVWLVLEETEDDAPLHQLQTYQVRTYETEEEGEALFEAAQEILHRELN